MVEVEEYDNLEDSYVTDLTDFIKEQVHVWAMADFPHQHGKSQPDTWFPIDIICNTVTCMIPFEILLVSYK